MAPGESRVKVHNWSGPIWVDHDLVFFNQCLPVGETVWAFS